MTYSETANKTQLYRACGFVIRSPVPLPLIATDSNAPSDVVVRCEPADHITACQAVARRFTVDHGEGSIAFTVAGLGRFGVKGGCEMTVPPVVPDTSARVGAMVLSSLMPHLCHQLGLVPLHAGAALLGGRVVAIAGPSGAGKSTLVAGLARRGRPILSDDLCAVDLSRGGAVVRPCAPWLKLCPAEAGTHPHAPVIEGKSWIDLGDCFQNEPAHLSAVLMISDGSPVGPVRIEPLAGADALRWASQAVSRWRQAQRNMGIEVLFPRLAALVKAVRLYRLIRPRTRERLDEVLDTIERFAREPGGLGQ